MLEKTTIITNAGGAGALATDYLTERGIKTKLIDLLGTATSSDYKKELNKHKNDNLLIIATPQKMTDLDNIAYIITNFKKQNSKSKITVCLLGDKSVKNATNYIKKNKIQVTNTLHFYN